MSETGLQDRTGSPRRDPTITQRMQTLPKLLLLAGVVELAASDVVTLVALCVVLLLLLAQLWLQRVYWYSTVSQ